jgi:hypothetical protein
LKAKTSYRRHRIELIVERLGAERKKLDIGIEAELEAEQREAERREVESSIEVAGKLDIAVEVASTESKLEVEDSSQYSQSIVDLTVVPLAVLSVSKLVKRLRKRDLFLVCRQVLRS